VRVRHPVAHRDVPGDARQWDRGDLAELRGVGDVDHTYVRELACHERDVPLDRDLLRGAGARADVSDFLGLRRVRHVEDAKSR
jgi:hypothetical protein